MSILRARSMRRNMSPAEAVVWAAIRGEQLKPYHFRRQVQIGPYYADFAVHGVKLVVEIDGSTHFEEAAAEYDARRDAFHPTHHAPHGPPSPQGGGRPDC